MSGLELNRWPGVIHASEKRVIIRHDVVSSIPVTKNWAWKRLLLFLWYPVFADASQMIGKIVRRGFVSTKVQTGFFAVRRSFFHSVKASIKYKVRVFLIFWFEWREFGLHKLLCDAIEVIAFYFAYNTAVHCYTSPNLPHYQFQKAYLLHCLVTLYPFWLSSSAKPP